MPLNIVILSTEHSSKVSSFEKNVMNGKSPHVLYLSTPKLLSILGINYVKGSKLARIKGFCGQICGLHLTSKVGVKRPSHIQTLINKTNQYTQSKVCLKTICNINNDIRLAQLKCPG